MKKAKVWIIVLLVLLVLAAAAVVLLPYGAYRFAESKLESGDYDTAAAVFQQLGAYRDSSQRIQDVETARAYALALKRLEDGDYTDACQRFADLGDYKDSAQLVTESTYRLAVSLLSWGNGVDYEKIAQARELLLSLGDYKDSKQHLAQFCWANIYISRVYTQDNISLDREPQWYDAQGRLTGRGSLYDQYAYDEEGRLCYDAPNRFEYDEENRIILEYNDERSIDYTYDEEGKVSSRTYRYKLRGRKVEHQYRYDSRYQNDVLIKESLYDNNELWNVNTYTYDDQGRVVENLLQNYAGRKFSVDYTFRYTYHEDGTVAQKENIYPNAKDSFVDTYLYGWIWAPEATTES